jgi:organic hydroperoxide reductase OsmC/OhrA
MTVHIRTVTGRGTSLAWTSGRSVTIDAGENAGELRIGFDADELLALAVGASYVKSLLHESARRRIRLPEVAVDVSTETPADGASDPGQLISVTVAAAAADERAIVEMIEQADRSSSIANRLRCGSAVRLAHAYVKKNPQA